MKFTFWISQRLKLNGHGNGANATGVVIAVMGVALALIIMEFTIAIVTGFKQQITQRITGFDGTVWVMPEYKYDTGWSAQTIEPDLALNAIIDSLLPATQKSMWFNQPGILKTDNDFAGVYFMAFDDDCGATFQKDNMVSGEFPDYNQKENDNKIVISNAQASSLQLSTGDKIYAYFFVNDAIKSRKFEVAGIYESGFGEYDRTMVYAPIATLRRIAQADSLSGTRLMIDVPNDADLSQVAADLQNAIIDQYQAGKLEKLYPVDNVRHTGAIYFNWLELLDTNVVVIFILMICVAGFTLVSSMFIIILERISTIGILRALGANRRQIRDIFVYMTLRIVGIGMLIGNAIGLGLLWLQKTYKILKLNPEMYYLQYVPVEMDWPYFLYLNIGVIIISWLILILPSKLASNVSPTVSMRFE